MGNRELVLQAVTELFGDRDPSAVDRWVAPTYRQHSALAADGPDALRQLVVGLPDNFRYEQVRVLADGDLVALHGVYHGFGPEALVAFDIFRVEDGKLAEHWDALQPQVAVTVSGRSQTDGPTEVTSLDQTEPSRKIVLDFVETILQNGQVDRITNFVSTEQYEQHNPGIGDGLDGLGSALAAWAEQGITMTYTAVHRSVAEGEFVLTQSEGLLAGEPTAFYDLFRVGTGGIVEHWDVMTAIPETLPHNNGLF